MSPSENSGADRQFARRPFLAASFVGLATLTACGSQASQESSDSSSSSASASATSASPSPTETPFVAKVEFNVKPKATDVVAIDPITAKITDGTFVSVELLADGADAETESEFNEDATTWTSTGALARKTNYTVKYSAKDKNGKTKDDSFTFTTDDSKPRVDTTVNFTNGSTYGVGWIIQFNLSQPVTDHAAYEKYITVTGGGDQKGKFRWYNDQMVRYRPENYWAPNSSVTVKIANEKKPLGDDYEGNTTDTLSFKVGPKRTALADNNTKEIQLFENDQLIHTNLITLGDAEWPSVIGKLVVMEQADSYFFDPTTLGLQPGDSHYYTPFYAHNVSRLTSSGVFVHQALPSAYAYVGVANVSHGCIGMMPEDAKYFFDTFEPGDIVETVNTGYAQADPDDGYGDWNIPFENYSDSNWKGNW